MKVGKRLRKTYLLAVLFALFAAVSFTPSHVEAGSSNSLLNGNQYYEIGGGNGTSILYLNGILLSNSTDPGYARWEFQIDGVPPTYNVSATVYYSEPEPSGDGPTISLYNWTSLNWDPIALGVGVGINVTYEAYSPSMNYVNAFGYVRVEVYADTAEFIDVGNVSVDWRFDDAPPSNPNSNVSTPPINNWTADNTVQVTWSGASDDVFGVAGYSIVWSQSPTTLPIANINTTGTTNTSMFLADGIWYLHIRTVDNAGNWNATAYHVGPFKIDTVAPASPVVQGPSTWSNDSTPQFTWSAPTDPSGILGYSYSMDSPPDGVIDTTSQSVVWSTLADGVHTFYVRACDQADNWGIPASYSFSLDAVLPTISIVSPIDGAIQNTSTVEVSWTGSDDLSGIDRYEVQIDSGSPINVGTNTSYPFVDVLDGNHIVNVILFDQAGNQRNATVSFKVDTTAPAAPDVQGPPAWSNVTTPEFTWTAPSDSSGISGYSYSMDSLPDNVTDTASQSVTWTPLVDGAHTFYIKACDQANNWGVPASYSFSLDTVLPSVGIISPNSGAIQNTSTIDMSWSGSDALSGIDHYEVQIDSSSPMSVGTALSYQFVSVADGSHTMKVTAVDKAGNRNSASVSVMVDTVTPSIGWLIDGTMGSNGWYATSVNVTITSSDVTSGVKSIVYNLDSAGWQTYSGPIQVAASGVHSLLFYSEDFAGNRNQTSLEIKIDTTQFYLVFSIQNGTIFDSNYVAISWTVHNAVSGIDHFEYVLDGGSFVPLGTVNFVGLTNLSEGSHVLTVRAFENAGNIVSQSLTFTVDTLPPSLSFDLPDGTLFSSNSVVINWISTDSNSGIDHFEYSLDGGAPGNTGNVSSVNLIGVSDGGHSLSVRAYDRAENVIERSVTFAVDTQPPALSFSSQGIAFFKSTSITISWTASDSVSGLSRFESSVDNGTLVSFGTSSSRRIDLVNVTEGSHIFTLRAYDKAGNIAEKSLALIVDLRPPTLALLIQNGTVFTSRPVTIGWLSADNGSGIDHFEFKLDSRPSATVGIETSVDLTDISEGSHALAVFAYDKAGNFARGRINFVIDTLPPSIEFDARDGDFFNLMSSKIGWSSSDNVTGVDHFTYRIDSGSFQNLGNVNSVNLTDLSDGSHVLTVRAYDKVGNVVERFITFVIDTQPPLLSFYLRDGEAISSWNVTIRFSSQDTISGIHHFEYSIDNSTFKSIGIDRFVKLPNLKEGAHVIKIRSFDEAGNMIEKSLTFQVTAIGSWLFVIVLVMGAIVALAVLLDLRRRGRGKAASASPDAPKMATVEYRCKKCGEIFTYSLFLPVESDSILRCRHCGIDQGYDPTRVERVL